MVAVNSTMLPLGTPAPAFHLPDTAGNVVSLEAFDGAKAYVVMFICNHCPYVRMLRREIAHIGNEYQDKGVAFVAINSNDVDNYPDDSMDNMVQEVAEQGYSFPYCLDETQNVAKAYRASCTPDFFVFNKDRLLVYRGQFDDARPGNGINVTGSDLRAALDAILDDEEIPDDVQKPSIGCNIKWKPGNEPEYFRSRA
ncbi:MAG: thioredoxin family protein [Verrucomicrobiota bacterium JB024]|nr:thioredoxin family protein [Verrucomicrobiota bacterium JB024]